MCVPLPCGQGGVCRVFATSTHQPGNLGGLTGTDAICQQRAGAAGLPGTYMTWLSDDTGSPSTRFVQSTGPYRRVDGVKVANNWADLTDGLLSASISVTEIGGTVPSDATHSVWSNTETNGTTVGDQVCATWASSGGGIGGGATGLTIATTFVWTNQNGADCNGGLRLYCFQQF